MDEEKLNKLAALQHQFNVCTGQTSQPQLYYDFHLWYKVRNNYWACIDKNCGCHITKVGDPANPSGLKYPGYKLPTHTCLSE